MPRLFVAFPRRAAGVGLLVVRLLLAYSLLASGFASLTHGLGASLLTACGLMSIAVGLLVATGFLTFGAQLAAISIQLAFLVLRTFASSPPQIVLPSAQHCIYTAVLAFGLALVGPGAYSIDARVFGPRELTIPPPEA